MFYRILLYIRKLKLLNTLFIIFITLAITIISLSISQIYRSYKSTKEFDSIEHSIKVTNTKILTTEEEEDYRYDINEDVAKTVFDLAYDLSNDSRVDNLSTNFGVNMSIKELDSLSLDIYETNFVFPTVNVSELVYEYEITEDFDDTKVYIDREASEWSGINIGDTITIGSYEDGEFSFDESYSLTFVEYKTVEVYGILEKIQLDEELESGTGDEDYFINNYGAVYIPYAELYDIEELTVYFSEIDISASESNLDDIYEELESGEYYTYYTKKVQEEDLKFFNTIQEFFIYLIIISFIVLILAFTALNKNVFERRRQEIQLYNIFGLSFKSLNIQLLFEKLVLIAIALIFAIPSSLFVFRKSLTIINSLVKYSFEMETKLQYLLYVPIDGEEHSFFDYYYIYSKVDVNKWLFVIIAIIIVTVVVLLITCIQLNLQKNRFVEQRRD